MKVAELLAANTAQTVSQLSRDLANPHLTPKIAHTLATLRTHGVIGFEDPVPAIQRLDRLFAH
jgi:hypothetical protein